MPHVIDYYGLAILIAVLGMCDGIYLSCLIPIVLEISNCPKLTNQLSGYYHSIISIPVILGPALSGMFFQKYQNYTYAFYMGGTCCLLCSLILMFNPGTLLSKCTFFARVRVLFDFNTNLNEDFDLIKTFQWKISSYSMNHN